MNDYIMAIREYVVEILKFGLPLIISVWVATRNVKHQMKADTDRVIKQFSLQKNYQDTKDNLPTFLEIFDDLNKLNQVYLERIVKALRIQGKSVDDTLLPCLSSLGWEHINLTGDHIWKNNKKTGERKIQAIATTSIGLTYVIFRILRRLQ